MEEPKKDTIEPVAAQPDHAYGSVEKIDDAANREFYGGSVSDSYRLKSELVSKCLEEIGMGRYDAARPFLTPPLPDRGTDTNGSSSSSPGSAGSQTTSGPKASARSNPSSNSNSPILA